MHKLVLIKEKIGFHIFFLIIYLQRVPKTIKIKSQNRLE